MKTQKTQLIVRTFLSLSLTFALSASAAEPVKHKLSQDELKLFIDKPTVSMKDGTVTLRGEMEESLLSRIDFKSVQAANGKAGFEAWASKDAVDAARDARTKNPSCAGCAKLSQQKPTTLTLAANDHAQVVFFVAPKDDVDAESGPGAFFVLNDSNGKPVEHQNLAEIEAANAKAAAEKKALEVAALRRDIEACPDCTLEAKKKALDKLQEEPSLLTASDWEKIKKKYEESVFDEKYSALNARVEGDECSTALTKEVADALRQATSNREDWAAMCEASARCQLSPKDDKELTESAIKNFKVAAASCVAAIPADKKKGSSKRDEEKRRYNEILAGRLQSASEEGDESFKAAVSAGDMKKVKEIRKNLNFIYDQQVKLAGKETGFDKQMIAQKKFMLAQMEKQAEVRANQMRIQLQQQQAANYQWQMMCWQMEMSGLQCNIPQPGQTQMGGQAPINAQPVAMQPDNFRTVPGVFPQQNTFATQPQQQQPQQQLPAGNLGQLLSGGR